MHSEHETEEVVVDNDNREVDDVIAEEEIDVERVGVLPRRSRRILQLQPDPVSKPESPQKKKNRGRPIKGGDIECKYPDCEDTLVKNQSLSTHLWWRHGGRPFDGVALDWQLMKSLQHQVRHHGIDQFIRIQNSRRPCGCSKRRSSRRSRTRPRRDWSGCRRSSKVTRQRTTRMSRT